MLQREDRRVEIDGQTALLGIDERLARRITDAERHLGSREIMHIERRGQDSRRFGLARTDRFLQTVLAVHRAVEQLAAGLIVGVRQLDRRAQPVLLLPQVTEIGFPLIVVLVNSGHLQRCEHVVLVGGQELVRRSHVVIRIRERHRVHGVFARQVLFLVERILHLAGIF